MFVINQVQVRHGAGVEARPGAPHPGSTSDVGTDFREDRVKLRRHWTLFVFRTTWSQSNPR